MFNQPCWIHVFRTFMLTDLNLSIILVMFNYSFVIISLLFVFIYFSHDSFLLRFLHWGLNLHSELQSASTGSSRGETNGQRHDTKNSHGSGIDRILDASSAQRSDGSWKLPLVLMLLTLTGPLIYLITYRVHVNIRSVAWIGGGGGRGAAGLPKPPCNPFLGSPVVSPCNQFCCMNITCISFHTLGIKYCTGARKMKVTAWWMEHVWESESMKERQTKIAL